jgi:hypothetical protein
MIKPLIRRHDLRSARETIGNVRYPRLQRLPEARIGRPGKFEMVKSVCCCASCVFFIKADQERKRMFAIGAHQARNAWSGKYMISPAFQSVTHNRF